MKSREQKQKVTFYKMFWLFIFGCVVGWFLEGLYSLLLYHKLINHSALVIGPFNVCYGICACALTFLLYRFKDKGKVAIFLISFVIGSILEYIMSWGMELVLGFSAWDYTGRFLNINGRICFFMSCLWGLLGILWIKYIYPIIEKILDKIPKKIEKKLVIAISIFLLLDTALTISAVIRAKEWEKGVEPRNFYERFLDKTFNKDYLYNMFNNSWSE